MKIEYLYAEGDTQQVQRINVIADGVVIGTIKRVQHGQNFGYTFVSSKSNGNGLLSYETLGDCQRALESSLNRRKNSFGLDVAYHKKELKILLDSLENRTPGEYKLCLKALINVVGD